MRIDLIRSKKRSPEIKSCYTKVLGIVAATIATLAGVGYWYVFIAGAAQINPPATNVPDSGMTFSLHFDTKAMEGFMLSLQILESVL